MKWIKFILLILCLSTFQSNFSQAIGIRTLTPVNKDVERPKYDTTFIYFDLSKLEDNPHYYDNQEILFSPCIDTVRYYNYFGGFFTKDSVEMKNCPDTIWMKKKQKKVKERDFYPGLYVYAEDIRSPFNLGSIFRTAEAFGAEKVFLSPGCTDPNHPRAVRSAMGCDEVIPYERVALADLPKDLPIFALETGGTDIREFDFPQKGIVVIGSEELGVSPEALALAKAGTVTIPMTGVKASLNVGVAFGILMERWTSAVSK